MAVDLASADGLEALSIGGLAKKVGMSKSGLFAHFGSKQDLQLATVEAARMTAVAEVLRPGLAAGPGLPRLWALLDRWLGYMEKKTFPGGCFFAAASAEFDGRPGPVRERIAAVMRDWLGALEAAIDEARARGQLRPDTDSPQLAFELNALGLGANWSCELHRDEQAFVRARRAVRSRLAALTTPRATGIAP